MSYRLKAGTESFEVVDGPFAGKRFLRGRSYAKIPPEEKAKFEEIKSSAFGVQGSELKKQKKSKPETQNPKPGTQNTEPGTDSKGGDGK